MTAARKRAHVNQQEAAPTTVEALMFALRRGPDALADSDALYRLLQLGERQLVEVMARLQKFRPGIAPAWTDEQLETLAAVRRRAS